MVHISAMLRQAIFLICDRDLVLNKVCVEGGMLFEEPQIAKKRSSVKATVKF